ncbi:MAG: hypothetical protein ACP5M8_08110 [Caldisphaera sp.]
MIIEKQGAGIKSSLLCCPIEKFDRLFFSLMDHLNNLFTSNDPEDILKFYDYFDDRDQLIKWMRERPKGNYRIVEFNKENNEIIVVIPTMDVNGKFALNCRNEIFKGLHIIFVESGHSNYYFNYAHNCNAGIKKAMEYNPKWILLSNDDMYKIYDIEILIKELNVAQEKGIDLAFPEERAKEGVAYRMNLGKTTIISKIFYLFYSKNTRITLKLERKYKIFLGKKFLAVGLNFPYSLFVKGYIKFINGGNFFIFNSKIF